MTFLNMKELETDRLILRKISKKDAPDMYEYAKDPEVSRYLTWSAHESLSYTTRYIKFLKSKYRSGEYFDWGIELKSNGKFIGTCGFSVFDSENRKAEIGMDFKIPYANEISAKTPNLCHLAPAGPTYMEDLNEAGGVYAVMNELNKKNLLYLWCWQRCG